MSTFRSKRIASAVTAVFLLSMFHLFGAATPTAFADAVTRTLTLPGGQNATVTAEFTAPGSLTVTATVRLQRNGSNDDFSNKRLGVLLISPAGAIAATRANEVGSTPVTLTLQGPASGTAACSEWRVTVRNEDAGCAMLAAANATVTFNYNALPLIQTLSAFGLVQNGTQEKSISVPGTGSLTITASWDTDEILQALEAFSLTFKLRKPNGTLAESDTGFAQNSNTDQNQKLKINYTVTSTDLSTPGDWKLEVVGSSKGKVKNVKITRIFVPGCN